MTSLLTAFSRLHCLSQLSSAGTFVAAVLLATPPPLLAADVDVRPVPALRGAPYTADFEAAEQYRLGNLAGQQGWSTPQGAAHVQVGAAASGAQFAAVLPGTPVGLLRREFLPADANVIFVELFAKPVAETSLAAASAVETGQSRVALLRMGTQGQVHVIDGARGGWRPLDLPLALPLAADGRTSEWIRLTLREDYFSKKWDLYINGTLKAADIGFRDPVLTRFSTFTVAGHATLITSADDLFVGTVNPLFVDQDLDGVDDAYENVNGLDPARNDRTGDRDNDGLSNIQEYLRGTRASLIDTDGDGLGDGWEVRYGFDPLVRDSAGDRDNDGLANLQEQAAGTHPARSDTDGDGLPDRWEVRHALNPLAPSATGDPDGDGASNLVEFLQGRNPTKGTVPGTRGVNLKVIRPSR